MRVRNFTLIAIAVTLSSGCASECTEEDLQEKIVNISAKVQAIAASGDVPKLMEFSSKANDISQKMSGSDDDLQLACQAADELLSEL